MQMLFNSKGVAVLLGACIALITTAFQSLMDGISDTALLVGFLLAFSSSYILISVTLEFLVFSRGEQDLPHTQPTQAQRPFVR